MDYHSERIEKIRLTCRINGKTLVIQSTTLDGLKPEIISIASGKIAVTAYGLIETAQILADVTDADVAEIAACLVAAGIGDQGDLEYSQRLTDGNRLPHQTLAVKNLKEN